MKTILYDITNKCNLRCKHCYNSDILENSKNMNSKIHVIESINNSKDINRIHILGGEPFLDNELFYFISKLREDISVSINTNGTLLLDYAYNILNTYAIDQITLSLDGCTSYTNDLIRGNGVFNKVINNIKIFNSYRFSTNSKIKLNLAYVITPNNLFEINKLPELAKRLNIDTLMVSLLYFEGNASKQFKNSYYDFEILKTKIAELLNISKEKNIEILLDIKPIFLKLLSLEKKLTSQYNLYKNSGCYAEKDIYYINYENEVFPCGPSSKIGNKKYKLYDLNYNSVELKPRQNEFFSGNIESENCINCIFSDICSLCPLEKDLNTRAICSKSKSQINRLVGRIYNKKISFNNEMRIVERKGSYYIINFKNKNKYKLFNNNISDEDLEHKTIGEISKKIRNKISRNIFLVTILEAYMNEDITVWS